MSSRRFVACKVYQMMAMRLLNVSCRYLCKVVCEGVLWRECDSEGNELGFGVCIFAIATPEVFFHLNLSYS